MVRRMGEHTERGAEPAVRPAASGAALPTTSNQALARMMSRPAQPTLARLTKDQERKLQTWKGNLQRAAANLESKPAKLFTPKFKKDHVKAGDDDTPPPNFQSAASTTATRRFEGKAKKLRKDQEAADKSAGTSSLIWFGPTALNNMKADMQAWAAAQGPIHTALKTRAGANEAEVKIGGGAGGTPCDETTGNQYYLSSIGVHARFDRQGGLEQRQLHIGPWVRNEGRDFKVHHFGGPA